MSRDKDLSVEVKTVLHGEVLGPDDEGYEPKKKGKSPSQGREGERQREQYQYFSQIWLYAAQAVFYGF